MFYEIVRLVSKSQAITILSMIDNETAYWIIIVAI